MGCCFGIRETKETEKLEEPLMKKQTEIEFGLYDHLLDYVCETLADDLVFGKGPRWHNGKL